MFSLKNFSYLIVLAILSLSSLPLFAQEQAPSSDQTTYEELKVTLAEPLVITPNEPSAVRAKFMEVIENKDGQIASRTIVGLEDVDIEGVLSAEAQSQMRTDGTLSKRDLARIGGNITWNAVSLKKQNENGEDATKRALLASPLLSNVDVEQASVDAGSAISAQGDINAAIMTAKNLIGTDTPVAETPKPEDQQQAQTAQPAPAVGGGASGGGQEGGQLGQTKAYDIQPLAEDAAPIVSTTTEGCALEADIQNELMIETNQLVTDGQKSGTCSPSGTTFKLTKSYATCTDEPVEAEKKVYARFRYSYVNAKGEQVYYDDETSCRRDPDNVFDLVEDENACPSWREDLATHKAYRQAKTVYIDRKNTTQQYQDCHDLADVDPVDIVENFDICGIKDYFAPKNYSAQMSRFTYDKKGTVQQALPCAENGTNYPHITVTNVCPPIEDYRSDKMDYIQQIRKKITTPNGELYVTLCEPDPDNSFKITSTVVGCESTYKHDMLGGQSIGTKKYQYKDSTGKMVDLKDGLCVEDTTRTYDHQYRITGYDHKDVEKKSYPETETYINTEFGKVIAETSRVKADAVAIPYTYDRTSDLPTGTSSYDDNGTVLGCNKYSDMAKTEIWKNADGTEVKYVIGTGTPVGPSYACQKSGNTLADWTLSKENLRNSCYVTSGSPQEYHGITYRDVWYSSTIKITRDDGAVISSNTYEEQSSQTQAGSAPLITWAGGGLTASGCPYGSGGGTPPAAPANPTTAEFLTWQANHGF